MPTPKIKVFGKPNCELCDAAKEKLDIMKFKYSFTDLDKAQEHSEGGRNDGRIEALSYYDLTEKLPVILIDGEAMGYAAAMKKLKGITRG